MKNKQEKESRLDRIERGLESLLQGTLGLKESQKSYNEERRQEDMRYSEKRKQEDKGYREERRQEDKGYREERKQEDKRYREERKQEEKRYSEKRRQAQKRYDEERKQEEKRYREERSEAQKKIDAATLELKEAQKQTDAQIQKTDKQLEKTIKKLDEIGRQLGDLGLVQGEVAEDLFYRNVRYLFKEDRDMVFSDVKRNLKKKGAGEYDIVAVNGDAVLVIEVKNKLQKRMVDRFTEKKLPKFTEIFPEFKGRRLFGGIGALVVKEDVSRYAEKAGLYVLTQTSEGGAALINRKNFRAKEFS